MRRTTMFASVALFAATTTAVALVAAPAQASPTPSIHVVASHLNNPRGLSMSAGGTSYLAEAGRGGKNCFTDPVMGTNCAGLTGSIDRVGANGVTRIVKGLISVGGPDGTGAEGMVAVSASGGHVYGQFAGNTDRLPGAPLPAFLVRPRCAGWGSSAGSSAASSPAGVGDHDFAWAARSQYLVPEQFPDSNPNGVLVAGGEQLVRRRRRQHPRRGRGQRPESRVLTFLGSLTNPVTDSVPTCAARASAIYVG